MTHVSLTKAGTGAASEAARHDPEGSRESRFPPGGEAQATTTTLTSSQGQGANGPRKTASSKRSQICEFIPDALDVVFRILDALFDL